MATFGLEETANRLRTGSKVTVVDVILFLQRFSGNFHAVQANPDKTKLLIADHNCRGIDSSKVSHFGVIQEKQGIANPCGCKIMQ